VAQPRGLWQKFRNTPQLAAGIGILAFCQLSGIAAFHKIVTQFYLYKFSLFGIGKHKKTVFVNKIYKNMLLWQFNT
jgi:hypothetical protein